MPFTFHPYLMQIASVNSCLFIAYLIALIGNADSQELDAPFSIAPFISCCDLGHFRQFPIYNCKSLFSSVLVALVYRKLSGLIVFWF